MNSIEGCTQQIEGYLVRQIIVDDVNDHMEPTATQAKLRRNKIRLHFVVSDSIIGFKRTIRSILQ